MDAYELNERINKALDIAWESPDTQGAHHKQWIIDQMFRALTGDDMVYQMMISCYKDGEWDAGIAP
jgi:hypothetical protein